MPLILNIDPELNVKLAVWHLTEDLDDLERKAHLYDQELELYQSFRNDTRKRQWLAARVILGQLLGESRPEVMYAPGGKPFLAGVGDHIAITHSGEYVAVIHSSVFRVGIDIERPGDRIFKVIPRFLNEEEIKRFGNEMSREAYYACWCAKESMFKLLDHAGLDLQNDLEIISLKYDQTGVMEVLVHLPDDADIYLVYAIMDDHWILTYTFA